MANWHTLTACEAAAAIAAGRLKPSILMADCLARIEAREPEVRAWVHIDPTAALSRARALDDEPIRTRLHGIPVGVKDVIDTADLPTEYGSPIYRGHQPACDAACVAQVREAGGVILGKTVSTEFATRHPGKTRNPRNLAHTPGGSSSGSAAAVADAMVPLAFGTQTSSSVIRPAAYCGVVGYKPTFNSINRAGLKFLSESLDTIGVLARSVPDAALLVEELAAWPATDFSDLSALKPTVGFCRTPWWAQADEATRVGLESILPRLAGAGARVTEVVLPALFDRTAEIQIALSTFEMHRALSWERLMHPQLISAHLTERLRAGGRVSRAQFDQGQTLARDCRRYLDEVFRGVDVLLAPSAPGEAPHGLESTGDPLFGLLWTLMHGPALTLPLLQGPTGLPIGVQVIGQRGRDGTALRTAEWLMRTLR